MLSFAWHSPTFPAIIDVTTKNNNNRAVGFVGLLDFDCVNGEILISTILTHSNSSNNGPLLGVW